MITIMTMVVRVAGKNMRDFLFGSIVIIVIIIVVALCSNQMNKVYKISEAKKTMLSIIDNRKNAFENLEIKDPWGTEYKTSITTSGEQAINRFTVSSAGPDQIFNTNDDLIEINDDLNWTNSGKVIGKDLGRGLRGFVQGLWDSNDGK